MGLFSSLFGGKSSASTVELMSDRIWMSRQAKFHGIGQDLAGRSGSVAVLLIAYFADTLEELNAIVAQYQGQTPAKALLAEQLSGELAGSLNLDPTAKIDLIVAERHPLLAATDQLLEFANGLPCQCRITHHLSLEDPLLQSFSGEWVADILKKLGMEENEAIESRMVSRRIQDAQRKMQARAIGNARAESAAEWIEKNMPAT
ncbi:MAG: hypothetical protein AB7O62_16435 [Pirellulales bacterium]